MWDQNFQITLSKTFFVLIIFITLNERLFSMTYTDIYKITIWMSGFLIHTSFFKQEYKLLYAYIERKSQLL